MQNSWQPLFFKLLWRSSSHFLNNHETLAPRSDFRQLHIERDISILVFRLSASIGQRAHLSSMSSTEYNSAAYSYGHPPDDKDPQSLTKGPTISGKEDLAHPKTREHRRRTLCFTPNPKGNQAALTPSLRGKLESLEASQTHKEYYITFTRHVTVLAVQVS